MWCLIIIGHYLLYTKLGGGFKYVLYTSRIFGKIVPFWQIFFQWGCNHHRPNLGIAFGGFSVTFPWLGVDVKSSSAMRGVIRKNISLVMNGPFFQKENYNKYIIDRCNCVHVYGKMMIIVYDSHDFICSMLNLNKHSNFLYVFFPQHLPPLEMLMGCALGPWGWDQRWSNISACRNCNLVP